METVDQEAPETEQTRISDEPVKVVNLNTEPLKFTSRRAGDKPVCYRLIDFEDDWKLGRTVAALKLIPLEDFSHLANYFAAISASDAGSDTKYGLIVQVISEVVRKVLAEDVLMNVMCLLFVREDDPRWVGAQAAYANMPDMEYMDISVAYEALNRFFSFIGSSSTVGSRIISGLRSFGLSFLKPAKDEVQLTTMSSTSDVI